MRQINNAASRSNLGNHWERLEQSIHLANKRDRHKATECSAIYKECKVLLRDLQRTCEGVKRCEREQLLLRDARAGLAAGLTVSDSLQIWNEQIPPQLRSAGQIQLDARIAPSERFDHLQRNTCPHLVSGRLTKFLPGSTRSTGELAHRTGLRGRQANVGWRVVPVGIAIRQMRTGNKVIQG